MWNIYSFSWTTVVASRCSLLMFFTGLQVLSIPWSSLTLSNPDTVPSFTDELQDVWDLDVATRVTRIQSTIVSHTLNDFVPVQKIQCLFIFQNYFIVHVIVMLQISFWILLLQGIYHNNMDTSTRLLSNKIIYNFVVVVYENAFQIIHKNCI